MKKRISKKVYCCIKQTSKKYKDRPSPPYPANECRNIIKIGNDGQKYISLCSLETGICKWILYSKDLIKKREEQIKQIKKNRENTLKKLSKRSSKQSKRQRSKTKRKKLSKTLYY